MRSTDISPLERAPADPKDALYGQVIARLRQWIQEGRLKEGDFLPSERELAQLFDVSRVPVREALKILEFTGVAEQIRGKGVRIKRITANKLISNIDFALIESGHTLKDLFEVRQAMEVRVAALAAERWNDEDMLALEKAVADASRAQAEGDDLLGSSMSFHTALIAASHNLAFQEVNLFLSDWLRLARQPLFRAVTLHEEGLRDHRDILARIKERDGAGAAAAVRAHLDRTWRALEAAMAEVKEGQAP